MLYRQNKGGPQRTDSANIAGTGFKLPWKVIRLLLCTRA
jgi:hypothetical protein